MKFIVILAVIALIALALRQKWHALPPQTKQMWGALFGMAQAYRQVKKNTKQTESTPNANRALVRPCECCGLHVPENEGVYKHAHFYCCAEHAQ